MMARKLKPGKILVKIPRRSSKSSDITGGLPRITELLEARNPSNPAVVSEIDGVVHSEKLKEEIEKLLLSLNLVKWKKYFIKTFEPNLSTRE